MKDATKRNVRYCKNSKDISLYIRAIQGHTGLNLIPHEVWVASLLHTNLKKSCFVEDAFLRCASGLIAGGRESI